jgi:hypothetical protein
MRRTLFIAAAAFAACSSAMAEERPASPDEARAEEQARQVRRDGFVWTNDACGASRYEHLLGENYAELHQAALPAETNVLDRGKLTTLEFRPGQLNIVVDGRGRIIAIGCF